VTTTTSTYQIAAAALTATVRNRDGATVEIVESAAYDAHPDFLGYVWRAIAAGYRVELSRA